MAKPRSVLSILVMGLLLGAPFVMLWLGRWTWALAYLGATLASGFAIEFLEAHGLLNSTPVLAMFTGADLVSMAVLGVIGIWHGLRLRASSLSRPWYRWLAVVPAAVYLVLLVLFLPVRVLLFQPFDIPSASCAPNLMLGDYVVVSKFAYGYSRFSFPFDLAQFQGRTGGGVPRRGDLAVFKLPSDTTVDYVKRVVGLPGERLRMINGVLHINGQAVKLAAVELPPEYSAGGTLRFFRETLPGGRSYVIADAMDNGSGDDTEEFVVPADHYFVMGDNRDNSQDSRYPGQVGFVPAANFVGPVVARVWNSDGTSLSNRPEETESQD